VPDDRDSDVEASLARAIAARPALEVEHVVYAAGGLAVAARKPTSRRADTPLVGRAPLSRGSRPLAGAGRLPAYGLKVLDLTRVIAGPVATRMLGALGADVLRIDDPHRPELTLHAVDGVIGKAGAVLDAGTEDGRQTLHRRPGALPCQLLDHASGYLIAVGVLAALGRRARTGEATHVSVSLARTARWLLDQGLRPARSTMELPADTYRTALGNGWSAISPPGQLDGGGLSWPHLPPAYGRAPPDWR
jgi:crotonobetainyl-CoA:carnitine CoA-transferase CaiB-like acyl-CoA transferase